ncbi:DUF4376 domain-containing protein [Lacrimispora sp.]|uniref:DUF4376 domain-containing protein n=1 Tax=Lacrimispora sp. TaxID=2719234 RepID=UPI002FDA895E
MKNEKIKVGETTYDIANGSCSLNNLSGYTATVAIIIGENSIEDIHRNLSGNPTIIKYSADGVEEWRSSGLVYTGKMRPDLEFPVRIDATTCSEVMDAVVIVEYRTPTIQDEIMAQRAQMTGLNGNISHLSKITGVGVEVQTSGQPTLEELKEAKRAEVNAACGQIICNGITVELFTGHEHFSLSQTDQLNLFGLQAQIASGAQEIIYHADGQSCRFYPASDIALLIEKAMFHASYHTTYANSLRSWIDSVETAEELQGIYYGADIPVEYQSDVLKAYLAQIAAMAGGENDEADT